MKKLHACVSIPFALAILMVGAPACRAADVPPPPSGTSAHPVNPVNYVLRVDWKTNKAGTNSLQLITTEGTFKLETSQPSAVKVGDSEVPSSVNVSGELKVLNAEQGRLQFFLGRSVPYVIRTGGSAGGTSIQQHQEGLTSAFIVTFGKPVLIQKDANGEVIVLVEREKP